MNISHMEIVPYYVWQHASGKTASIHGALPYYGGADKANWKTVQKGFTVYNRQSNTYGCGQPPFADMDAGKAWLNRVAAL